MIDVDGGDRIPVIKFNGPQPRYQTIGSAGADVSSSEDAVIPAGGWSIVPTGLFLEIPRGYECQVRSRSGLAAKEGVFVLNSPGTIDCFTPDNLISTPAGKKTVFDLKINDEVFSLNEKTLQIEKDIISAIIDVGVRDVIKFTFVDNATLCVTPGTMVYTRNGPKRADQLTLDDEIVVDHDT